jgi:hypothetical protein
MFRFFLPKIIFTPNQYIFLVSERQSMMDGLMEGWMDGWIDEWTKGVTSS